LKGQKIGEKWAIILREFYFWDTATLLKMHNLAIKNNFDLRERWWKKYLKDSFIV